MRNRKSPVQSGEIKQMALMLSDRTPIRIDHYVMRQRGQTDFDMHFELELGIVLSGKLRRIYGGKTIDLRPGQVWLSGIWEPHGTQALETPCELVIVLLWPGLLANMRFPETPDFNALPLFTSAPTERPQVSPSKTGQTLSLGRHLLELAGCPPPQQKLWLRIRLLEILLILYEKWEAAPSPLPPAFQSLDRAINMVFTNHLRTTIDSAAKSCDLSRFSFQKSFRKTMGISFAKFALRYRLSGAADQIFHTQKPMKIIASEWGFVDESHFHHHFLKHYGCSPSEYRRQKGRIL